MHRPTPDPLPPATAPRAEPPWTFPDAPLVMPVQDLDRAPSPSIPRRRSASHGWRRALLVLGSAGIGVVASRGLAIPLAIDGYDLADTAMSLLSLALFSWIAFGALNAVAGFVILSLGGRVREAIERLPQRPVAILVPAYNEDMAAVTRRIERIAASLAAVDATSLFDFFVLSDSQAAAEPGERAAVALAGERVASRILYRRRPLNVARKPGNVAEWVCRSGGAYESMIVLDADSLMAGPAMIRLAVAMEDEPTLGLIQTNPLLIDGRTLFARWQQFAAAFYGPIASAGLAWWTGDEASFWGHNAIVRVAAFAESCGLPRLAGKAPFGGDILSHDLLEAALLRRRGWGVRMMPMAGSYEESPPTLIDQGIRDRRWCQGNLQHLHLLGTGGLHWISRLQLLMGASAYLTAPMWLALLLMGIFEASRNDAGIAALISPGWLIGVTILLLFGTKLLALAWAWRDRRLVDALGGWGSILRSIAADVPLSILTAPVIMASQCRSIVAILSGRPSGWLPQRRDCDGLALDEALAHYRWHMVLGAGFLIAALSGAGGALWSLPIAAGLLAAPWIAMFTSRTSLGTFAMQHRVFAGNGSIGDRQPWPAVRPAHRSGGVSSGRAADSSLA